MASIIQYPTSPAHEVLIPLPESAVTPRQSDGSPKILSSTINIDLLQQHINIRSTQLSAMDFHARYEHCFQDPCFAYKEGFMPHVVKRIDVEQVEYRGAVIYSILSHLVRSAFESDRLETSNLLQLVFNSFPYLLQTPSLLLIPHLTPLFIAEFPLAYSSISHPPRPRTHINLLPPLLRILNLLQFLFLFFL